MPSSRWLKPVPSKASNDEPKPAAAPNVSMRDLRLLEQQKRQRDSQTEEGTPIPQQGIPTSDTPNESLPTEGIPSQGIPKPKSQARKAVSPTPLLAARGSAERGFYPTFNDLDDHIIPGNKLDTYEQSVLRRLYRLSRGFKSLDCEVGLGGLSKACNIARSKAQNTIASLIAKGLIRPLGHSQAGTKYRVLEQLPPIPPKGIPPQGIPQKPQGIPEELDRGIPHDGNNKKNKELINTHTNTVGGCSRFSLEECRRYAQHLQLTGQGINNPGGYATTVHRTGEADELIERFLNPTISTQVDASQCPDCKGSGFYYPNGPTGGVAKCKHEKLRAEG